MGRLTHYPVTPVIANEYRVTFGQKWSQEAHPVLGIVARQDDLVPWVIYGLPQSWVTIEAPSLEVAIRAAREWLGPGGYFHVYGPLEIAAMNRREDEMDRWDAIFPGGEVDRRRA